MKYFILLFITSFAQATTLSRFISTPDGVFEQRFDITKNEIHYLKGSNYFDKQKTLSLGEFELKTKKDVSNESNRIEAILNKVKAVDEFLKKKNSGFNDLTPVKPHASLILLDDFRINQESNLYPELLSIFEKLQRLDWIQESGVRLSADYKTLSIIKDRKETSHEKFLFENHCKKLRPPTTCTYKRLGTLYLD